MQMIIAFNIYQTFQKNIFRRAVKSTTVGALKRIRFIPISLKKTPKELFTKVDRAVRLYNQEKTQSKLGNLSPITYEEKVSP
jgi:transposase InsO family protein